MALGNQKGPFSEINVTPLVDVMLVLLVIFMITAPLMFNGIQLNLPKTREVNPINLNSDHICTLQLHLIRSIYRPSNNYRKNPQKL